MVARTVSPEFPAIELLVGAAPFEVRAAIFLETWGCVFSRPQDLILSYSAVWPPGTLVFRPCPNRRVLSLSTSEQNNKQTSRKSLNCSQKLNENVFKLIKTYCKLWNLTKHKHFFTAADITMIRDMRFGRSRLGHPSSGACNCKANVDCLKPRLLFAVFKDVSIVTIQITGAADGERNWKVLRNNYLKRQNAKTPHSSIASGQLVVDVVEEGVNLSWAL